MADAEINKLDFAKKIPLIVLVCAAASFPAENIVNYASPVTVSDFLAIGDTLWAASSGGLVAHDLRGGGKTLISNAKIFPDPYLTALCRDQRGNLWIGSRRGYLYRKTPQGQFTVFPSYKYWDWGITCLFAYGELLVVGSDRGVSLFDPGKGAAIRNAAGISTFWNPRVNAIAAFGNTLILGGSEGAAYLDRLDAVPLAQRNFYDAGIWKRDAEGRFGEAGRSGPVASFVNNGGSVTADSVPAAMFRGYKFTADTLHRAEGDTLIIDVNRRLVYRDESGKAVPVLAVPFGSKILKLYNEGDDRLWIGTDERYYYSYDGESAPEQHRIDGLALKNGSRVMVAENSDVWVLPMAFYPNSWYHGIYRYDGSGWHSYSALTYGERFGNLGDGRATGGAFGRDGTFWAGMSGGGNIKHIDPVKKTIGQLIVGATDFKNIRYYDNVPVQDDYWGRVDALAMDSSGYLWASAYSHNFGSLICYDPRYAPAPGESNPVKAHYRWFFDEPPLKTRDIIELSVDAGGRLYAYDRSQRQLTVFRHRGSPLADSVKVDTAYTSFGVVSVIRAAPGGGVYVACDRGLVKIPAGPPEAKLIDSTLTNISDLAVQENVLWLGTAAGGVLRFDIDTKEKKWIGEAEGLPSDNIVSVAIDGKKGYLWIVTESAVSRLDIGRTEGPSPREPVRIFPNVFSISGRAQGTSQVTFARLDPRSTVSVYTVNGALVARVSSEYFTENEWRAAWTPKRTLAPGTYIAVIKPSGKKAKILLKP